MMVEERGGKKFVVLTMEEAVLLKRAAWDGPEPNAAEQRKLSRLLEKIEAVSDEEG